MHICFFSSQPVAAHPRGIGRKTCSHLCVGAHFYRRVYIGRRLKSNSFNFLHQQVSLSIKATFRIPLIHNMTTDCSRSIRTIYQPVSGVPIQIDSESEFEVKSLDGIKTLEPERLSVRVPRVRRGPSKSDGASRLQSLLLRVLYTQISAVIPRTAASTRSNAGSKGEAGLEEISSQTAT